MTIIDLYEVMASSKADMREKVVKKFLKECAGMEKETSRYEYTFEKYDLSKGGEVYFKDYENNVHPIAIILLAIKWLFISEDISYWNWSGRSLFYEGSIGKRIGIEIL